MCPHYSNLPQIVYSSDYEVTRGERSWRAFALPDSPHIPSQGACPYNTTALASRCNRCLLPGKDTQPPVLFETPHFYAVPDKFPITQGHILLIPKHHLPCWAALAPSLYGEFSDAQNLLKAFIRDAYGKEPLLWENGGAWQSVHHAHLHFIPMPASVQKLPPPYVASPVRKWSDVRRTFFSGSYYQYAEYFSDRRIFPPGSPDLNSLSLLKVKALNISIAANGTSWIRTTSPTDIADTVARWKAWSHEHGLPAGFSQGTPSPVSRTAAMRITEPML